MPSVLFCRELCLVHASLLKSSFRTASSVFSIVNVSLAMMKCTTKTLSLQSAKVKPVVSCRPFLRRRRLSRCPGLAAKAQADEDIEEVPADIWDSPAIGIAVQVC